MAILYPVQHARPIHINVGGSGAPPGDPGANPLPNPPTTRSWRKSTNRTTTTTASEPKNLTANSSISCKEGTRGAG